jgi:MFS family permease
VIALLCAYMGASTFAIGAFPALLPDIGRARGLADWELGVLAGAFGFARMVADVPVGLFITHRLRRALLLSPVLLAGGIACLGSGGPLPVLVLGRAVMGVAHALGAVATLTAVLRFQVAGRLASALSAVELSAMLGVLAGTTAIGLLPAGLPWNVALLITCAPQLVGIVLAPLVLRALPREAPAPARPLFARGAGGARAPLTSLALLAFVAGGAVALTYATLEQFVIPLRGSREFGLDRRGIARLLITVQLCDIACLLPAGALSDRHGTPRVLGTMLLAFATAAALVVFGDFRLLVLGCVLYGVGMASWTLPLSVLRGETAPDQVAWRTALYRVGVDGGIFLGPFLSGLLAARAPALLPVLLAAGLALVGVALLRRHALGAPPAARAARR